MMPRKLQNLTIHTFRQIREMHFHDFRDVNLLVGTNNSGKTSVLESIALFCRPLDPLELIDIVGSRNVDGDGLQKSRFGFSPVEGRHRIAHRFNGGSTFPKK